MIDPLARSRSRRSLHRRLSLSSCSRHIRLAQTPTPHSPLSRLARPQPHLGGGGGVSDVGSLDGTVLALVGDVADLTALEALERQHDQYAVTDRNSQCDPAAEGTPWRCDRPDRSSTPISFVRQVHQRFHETHEALARAAVATTASGEAALASAGRGAVTRDVAYTTTVLV